MTQPGGSDTLGHVEREARALVATFSRRSWDRLSDSERDAYRREAREIAEAVRDDAR